MYRTGTESDVAAAAREIAARVLAPRAAHHDSTGEFPAENLAALGGAGLMGLLVPHEYGGPEVSIATFVEVVETLAQACSSTALVFVMHHCQYAMIVDHGTARQKETFLPPIARGEELVASATTEPETGGNAAFCVSAKERDGQRLRLTATKPVVTSANYADWIYCTTRAAPDSAGDELSVLIMPGARRSERVEPFGVWDCIGMRATSSSGLRFTECEVPCWHQIGPDDSAHVRASSMTIVSRAGFAAVWQGIADAAFDEALAHVQRKRQDFIRRDSGSSATRTEHRTLASSETTQRQLAEMRVRTSASRALLYSAARLIDEHREDLLGRRCAELVQDQLWSARIACGESAVEVTRQALRVCGVTGLRATGPLALERRMRDALTSQVMAPSEDATKLMLGGQLAAG
ncbi:MAG TPA: acyl-CoA dehydrogenase family protein [Solirubrobacteraceae bacterium]|nr:acyl-CoA dehydrogenase family protein [Solirubrobacteraceae bacterium]